MAAKPRQTRTRAALEKAYRSTAIRKLVKEKMETTEMTEAGDKGELPAAKMGIWDNRVKSYIRSKKMTVQGVEDEWRQADAAKKEQQIGSHCFEFDVGFDNEPGSGKFEENNELSEVLND